MEGRFIYKFRGGWYCLLLTVLTGTLLPQPLSYDPQFIQYIYRYSHASKCFVEVYHLVLTWLYPNSLHAGKFSSILCCLLRISKLTFSKKYFRNTIRAANSLDLSLVACQLYLVVHEGFNGWENLKIHYKCRYVTNNYYCDVLASRINIDSLSAAKKLYWTLGATLFFLIHHILVHKILVIQNDIFFMHWVPFTATLKDSMSTVHPWDHTFILKSYGIFHTDWYYFRFV